MINKDILYKALDMYEMKESERLDEELKKTDINTDYSKKFKIKINRIFREKFGEQRAIHTEVDNLYERIRSRIIYYLFNRRK